MYAAFVGYPLLILLGLLAFEGRKFIRVWREKQYPPEGMKTYALTSYIYGVRARFKAGVFFFICAGLLGMSIYGAVFLQGFTAKLNKTAWVEEQCASHLK